MMPGSALTRLLNGTPELVSSADLSVIAGDIEAGDGLWNTLKVLATDWFYRTNTTSSSIPLDERRPAAPRPTAPACARTRGRRSIISAISPTNRACAG
jgi:hypothetical protein